MVHLEGGEVVEVIEVRRFGARPTFSQLLIFQIRSSTLLNYIKLAIFLILALWDCERARRAVATEVALGTRKEP